MAVIQLPPQKGYDVINPVVKQFEEVVGPLIDMHWDDASGKNIFTFDAMQNTLREKFAVVSALKDVPQGSKEVCKGTLKFGASPSQAVASPSIAIRES